MKTLSIVIDTREQMPLEFPAVVTCTTRREALSVGDYGCQYSDGTWDDTVFERKGVGDLFNSYTHNYDNEKKKILRAKEANKKFVLAVEAPARDILKGYEYSKKEGMTMLRQLMSMMRRYGVTLWLCSDRREMATMIQEYYLSGLRV